MSKKSLWRWDGMTSVFRVLLVVCLLFLLFPILTQGVIIGAKENARRVSCESNMKQLGLALLQYSQDSDGTLPIATVSRGHNWREALYPYIKSVGVFQCPDDHGTLSATPKHLPHSYGANAVVMIGGIYASPAAAIAVTDMRGYDGPEWNITSPAFLPGTGRELYAHVSNRHFVEHINIINCLFTDGRVKSLPLMDTLTPTNLWARDNRPFTGADLANAQAILKHAEEE